MTSEVLGTISCNIPLQWVHWQTISLIHLLLLAWCLISSIALFGRNDLRNILFGWRQCLTSLISGSLYNIQVYLRWFLYAFFFCGFSSPSFLTYLDKGESFTICIFCILSEFNTMLVALRTGQNMKLQRKNKWRWHPSAPAPSLGCFVDFSIQTTHVPLSE